jgi:hypothetical protein
MGRRDEKHCIHRPRTSKPATQRRSGKTTSVRAGIAFAPFASGNWQQMHADQTAILFTRKDLPTNIGPGMEMN